MQSPQRLVRPEGLERESWAAIEDYEERLLRAVGTDDRPLVVGAAKELTEAVAKVVAAARGELSGAGDSYPNVISAAHRALDRQPGEGLASDEAVRRIASAAKTMALSLRELRNDYGTGHGRGVIPAIGDELLDTTVEAALLWCRWALRRLASLLAGQPDALARDLQQETFTRGTLAQRLVAANLPALGEREQHMIGLAVGQRAARGTFVVMEDGVSPCADTADVSVWPVPYREGVAEGLLVSRAGYIDTTAGYARRAASVLALVNGSGPAVRRLVDRLRTTPWAAQLRGTPTAAEVIAALEESSTAFRDPDAADNWHELADVLAAGLSAHE